MSGLLIWIRRTWPLALVFSVTVLLNWGTSPGFWTDWSWMVSITQGATLLMGPLAAGAAALLIRSQWPREVQFSLAGTPRHWWPLAHAALAVLFWAEVVLTVFLLVGAVLLWATGANPHGLTLPWQLIAGQVVLVAAVALGVAAITWWPGLLTPPLLVVGVFLFHWVQWDHGLPQVFSLNVPTGISTPLRPIAAIMVNDLVANVAAAIALVALVAVRVAVRRGARLLAAMVSAVGWLLVAAFSWYALAHLPRGTYA